MKMIYCETPVLQILLTNRARRLAELFLPGRITILMQPTHTSERLPALGMGK